MVFANFVPVLYLAGTFVLSLAVVLIPAGMGVAMLRFRLYDIDLVINRTLVYGALTTSLVLLYVGGVVGLQYVFRIFAGEAPSLRSSLLTLLIAALFNPLRRRIQAFMDRRFYRRKYDAAKTLEDLAAKLRNETDLGALSGDILRVVRDTCDPNTPRYGYGIRWRAPRRGPGHERDRRPHRLGHRRGVDGRGHGRERAAAVRAIQQRVHGRQLMSAGAYGGPDGGAR